jgi:hypothetical protein
LENLANVEQWDRNRGGKEKKNKRDRGSIEEA